MDISSRVHLILCCSRSAFCLTFVDHQFHYPSLAFLHLWVVRSFFSFSFVRPFCSFLFIPPSCQERNPTSSVLSRSLSCYDTAPRENGKRKGKKPRKKRREGKQKGSKSKHQSSLRSIVPSPACFFSAAYLFFRSFHAISHSHLHTKPSRPRKALSRTPKPS